MNIKKQIEYWSNSSELDFETAELLIEKKKFLHGLFFCHLSVEKILKGVFVKTKNEFAPKTHDLIYLVNRSELDLNKKYLEFLPVLMKYQLEGRYPDYKISSPDETKAKEYLQKTKELLQWLKKKL